MRTTRFKWLAIWGLLGACSGNVAAQKPNILWITGEDVSAQWLGCYGNTRIKTRNFDRFAREEFLYTKVFAHTPVCAPARSGWITGLHPVSTGTIYMRSQNALPTSLTWYPDALRANGYYAANFTKTDYKTSNRRAPGFGGGENQGTVGHFLDSWDAYEAEAWKSPRRQPNQPFFQVNNAAGCHESYLHKDEHTNEDVDPLAMELASSLTDGRYRYTWYGGRAEGAEEFYDHSLDPLEHRNLAGNPSYREIMAQFRQHLPVRNEPDSPKNGSADGDKKVMRTTGKANKAK